MNDHARKPKSHNRWTAGHEAAVEHLSEAARQAKAVDTPANRQQLASAVDKARDAGVGWTKIGDTLGIASGNAYQRYRRRRSDAGQRPAGHEQLPSEATPTRS